MWFNTPKFDPIKLMSSNKALFGVHMGLLEDPSIFKGHLDAISNMLERGEIDPIIDGVWRFEEVAEAQMHMHNRKKSWKDPPRLLSVRYCVTIQSLTGLVAPQA